MNALLIWLTINAIIGLPVLGFAIYYKVEDLRSKKSNLDRGSNRETAPANDTAIELIEAA